MTRSVLALLFAASGCAAIPGTEFSDRVVPTFGAFTREPRNGAVAITVNFGTADEIRAQCWRANGYRLGIAPPACIEGRTVWITRPRSWEDPYVCALGHEVLHALGAEHR